MFWRLYAAGHGHGHSAELSGYPDRSASRRRDPDLHRGAVEGDRPGDPQQWNRNAPAALDDRGMPEDCVAIAEDVIGATVDETEGG
jgi:hypothetical protein